MPSTFRIVTDVVAPAAALFDASLSIDLHLSSMSASGEQAVGGVTGGMIGLGETVTWSARHFGVRWRMTSEISELERGRMFVDRQVSGPFRTFVHLHEFTPIPGGTRMVDTITLQAPVAGRAVERLILVPYLRRLIRRRNAHLIASITT